MLNLLEVTEADSLRAQTVSEMCTHFAEYAGISKSTVHADMPSTNQYRILAMVNPKEMVGELEIVAMSKLLKRMIKIHVGKSVLKYGNFPGPPLVVKYFQLGDDVGHNECILPVSPSGFPTATTSNQNVVTPDMISPIRRPSPPNNGTRKRLHGKSELLTSSPYKDILAQANTIVGNRKQRTNRDGKSKALLKGGRKWKIHERRLFEANDDSWYSPICDDNTVDAHLVDDGYTLNVQAELPRTTYVTGVNLSNCLTMK